MRTPILKRTITWLLAVAILATSLFPNAVLAAEFGAQMDEAGKQAAEALQDTAQEPDPSEAEAGAQQPDAQDAADNPASDESGREAKGETPSAGEASGSDGQSAKREGSVPDQPVTVEVTEHGSADDVLDEDAVGQQDAAQRLIVTSQDVPADLHGAVCVDHYDDIFILTFADAEARNLAYDAFVMAGYAVEKDASIDAIRKEEVPKEEVKEEITDGTAEVTKEDPRAHETVIAVIDTGFSEIAAEDAFAGKVLAGASVISDSYADDNGHGTAIAKLIAEDTAGEGIYILPIKALDQDGIGTVAAIALAMKYAKEQGADVISLSLSGMGQSNILTNLINDCYNHGITVVTAAGNDASDAMAYLPGNVDAAVNVSAAQQGQDGDIQPAAYTNHGVNVDFAAMGSYVLQVAADGQTMETQLCGTSIAAAHVAAYVAMLKQINAAVGLSESGVYESLKASAEDLGDAGFDPYFGNGYLTKEALLSCAGSDEDAKKDTGLEETAEDGMQEVRTSSVLSDLKANGDRTINLTGDIDLPQTALGSGTKTINGNGHTIWFTGCGNMLEVNGAGNRLVLNSCVLNGARSAAPYGLFGNQLACATNGAVVEANWCTFRDNRTGSPATAGSNTGLASSNDGKIHAAFCTFQNISGFGMLVNSHHSETRAHEGYGEAYGCVFHDIDGAGFSTSKGTGKAAACTAYSCGKGFALNGRPDTIEGCCVYNCGTGVYCGGEGVTITSDATNGNKQTRIQGNDVGVDLYNGATANIVFSFISSGCMGSVFNSAVSCHGDSTCNVYMSRLCGYNDGYYYDRYGDLQYAFGGFDFFGRLLALRKHWAENGMAEGRVAGTDTAGGGRAGSGVSVSDNAAFNANGIVEIRDNYNGVYMAGGTVTMQGENSIFNNEVGISVSGGTANIRSGTKIYSNNAFGIDTTGGTTNISDGMIYDNNRNQFQWAAGAGIRNNGGVINISGGMVFDNGWGNIWNNAGTLNIGGGLVYEAQGQYRTASYGIWNNGTANIYAVNLYGYTVKNSDNAAAAIRNCGTLTVSGTWLAVHDSYYGLHNQGAATLNAPVYGNTIGLFNEGGTATITGGFVKDSRQMNVDVYNGTVNFTGGSITGSGTGNYGVQIENIGTATFNQYADIGANHAGAVWNLAVGPNRYNVHNGAACAVGSAGNDIGVFLNPGASMTIKNPLARDIRVASFDRYTGKVIAYCADESVANSAAQHLKLTGNAAFQKTTLNTRRYADTYTDVRNAFGYNYEALWNHYNLYGRNEGRAAEDCNKTVAYRKGNGATGARTQIIVSQLEETSFDENLAANGLTNDRFSARIRTSDAFTGHRNAQWRNTVTTYWGEANAPRAESIVYLDGTDVSRSVYNSGWSHSRDGAKAYGRILSAYAAWYPATLYAKYETGYDPNANHNPTDRPEQDDGTDDILDPAPQAPDSKDGDGPQAQGYSYFFNGNRQDTGKNFTLRHVSASCPLPGTQRFTKADHTGQGWSILPTATYKDTQEPTKMRREGETVHTLALLNACLGRDDCELSVSPEGDISITQYAVWDRIPVIKATDIAIAAMWLDTMSDDELMDMIYRNTRAKDLEDGALPNNHEGPVGVTIIDFDKDELRAFRSTGNVTITFRATDGVGNTADQRIRLWVVSKDPVDGAYLNRARKINETYYDTHDYSQGGLMPTDLWYTDPEYAAEIKEAFANLKNERWQYTWRFTHAQVLESQEYVETHGIANTEDEDGLRNYFEQFKDGFTDYGRGF